MKYQDEVEAGKRSRKSELTMAEQLQYYRNKLLQKVNAKILHQNVSYAPGKMLLI